MSPPPRSSRSISSGSDEWEKVAFEDRRASGDDRRRNSQSLGDEGRLSGRRSSARDEGEVRRSQRPSHREDEGEERRPRTSLGEDRRSSNRKSYGLDDAGDVRRSAYRNSRDFEGQGDLPHLLPSRSSVERSSSKPPMTDVSDAETEVWVDDEVGWQKISEAFPGGLPSEVRRSTMSGRNSYGQIREEKGDAGRLSQASRKSYGQDRDDEGEVRRSTMSGRNSYGQIREDEGDAGRLSQASRKSYGQDRDDEGEVRRSTMSGRNSYGQIREDEGDSQRLSQTSGKSYGQGNDAGELRRSVDGGRKSYGQDRDDEGRGRSSSRAERGSGSRMLSRPPQPDADSDGTEIYIEGHGWTSRAKAEARPSLNRQLRLYLNPDSYREMKSIIWKFDKDGTFVKGVSKYCPEPSLKAGDELMSINGTNVQHKMRKEVEEIWGEAQEESEEIALCFLKC